MRRSLSFVALLTITLPVLAADGNRLTYLDENNPYYPHLNFPKLITPQWVGEEGVECVVVLAIDDMRDPPKYEQFLRPILQRLKQIDGRAPVSIMTCTIKPDDPQLQAWLDEGLSLEIHTVDHPCPLLQGGDFAKAKSTYDRCVDLLFQVPRNQPVAMRMPCCDSLNTVSPRFYAEIFNRTTEQGHFLAMSSSVFNLYTSADPAIPRELVIDADGRDKFRKYLPKGLVRNGVTHNTFVNWIENYPYPYVINHLCWEFPCVVPSDWEANFLHQPNNPDTVRDLKAALDITVRKQGTFNLVFHPHGWIKSEQVVELIDHAVQTHGQKVKFLTFREALERLNKNLLHGRPLRDEQGRDNGVRLVDVNGDGLLDVTTADSPLLRNRPRRTDLSQLPEGIGNDNQGLRFVDLNEDGYDDLVFSNAERYGAWLFENMDKGWSIELLSGKRGEKQPSDEIPMIVRADGSDNGCFVHSRHLFWQNEDAAHLPDMVDRRAFSWFLGDRQPGPKSPEASLKTMKPRDGFTVELMAAEPLTMDPVAFEWGADGKLWIVEMGDYPSGSPKDAHTEIRSGGDKERGSKGTERTSSTPPLPHSSPPPLPHNGGGRIRYLEDTDGDGKYDKSTLFLDGVAFPTGIRPWRQGVLVTAAPDIFYAEDTDGDGKADHIEVLYTGFAEGNQQHRVNGLVPGLDNWLYLANGDSAGTVWFVGGEARSRGVPPRSGPTRPGSDPIDTRGRDLRIHPRTGRLDPQTGQSQYGRSRDDWGNWFGCNNSNPMYQFVLADEYIRRNPHLAAPNARVNVSVTPGAAPVFPISRTLERFNDFDRANRFTSACSVIVYRDDLFGPLFAGNSFVSEPVHNLVHREIMSPDGEEIRSRGDKERGSKDTERISSTPPLPLSSTPPLPHGVTFTSRRAVDEQESEFLASSDNWFRPTMIKVGPDGALWIADMYRHVIEHPQWIPQEWQQRLNLRAGEDMGRLYRVYPVGKQPRAIPRLDRLSTPQLVAALDSPNGWQRDMTQQLLVERNDPAAIPLLETQATNSQNPLCRLHSLCTLDGLHSLKAETLAAALKDNHPGVRRHAVRLCESHCRVGQVFEGPPSPSTVAVGRRGLGPPYDSPLLDSLLRLVQDDDPHVRMQLAYTLGEINDPRAGLALGDLARRDANDQFLLAAVMSSVNSRNIEAVVRAALAPRDATEPNLDLMQQLLAMASALGNRPALAALLDQISTPTETRYAQWQFAAVERLLETLERRRENIAQLQQDGGESLVDPLQKLDRLFAAARELSGDATADLSLRSAAVRLLGRGSTDRAADESRLLELLSPQTPPELQAAAIATLGRLRNKDIPQRLIGNWQSYGPGLRNQVLDVLLSRDDWRNELLTALEQQRILPRDLDAIRQQRLLEQKSPEVRERARKLLAGAVNSDRHKVIEQYRTALMLNGDAAHGGELFHKTCAQCHKLNNRGHEVGPDLAALTDKSPEALLTAMLDPNRAVEAKFLNYTAITKSGLTFSGILAAETGNSLTLRGAEAKEQTILRGDLEELLGSSKSMMPEGLEKDLQPRDFADLIAYVRANVPLPPRKEFPGNEPSVVQPAADGSLVLTPKDAEIYGATLVLEPRFGNLGYWSSPDDHAVWTITVPPAAAPPATKAQPSNAPPLTKGGPGGVAGQEYAVVLEWSCHRSAAGNLAEIKSADQSLRFSVGSTNNWETYKTEELGHLTLPAGPHRLTLRPAAPIKEALMDFKSLKLLPVR